MCTGDMGFTESKKYDLEVWSPGQQRWLEVSSCSNFGSYQARRMQLRYRNDKEKIEMAHTLNGSGLALPRIVASILETYQTEKGDVVMPDVLVPFMGKASISRRSPRRIEAEGTERFQPFSRRGTLSEEGTPLL